MFAARWISGTRESNGDELYSNACCKGGFQVQMCEKKNKGDETIYEGVVELGRSHVSPR